MNTEVRELLQKATLLVNQAEPWKDATNIIPMRKALVIKSRDAMLDESDRQHLLMAAEACKMAVNHVPLRERLKGYPESKLYGHESLTGKCRSMVVKLARRFEFAPSPMVMGIKHYIATK